MSSRKIYFLFPFPARRFIFARKKRIIDLYRKRLLFLFRMFLRTQNIALKVN